MKITYPANNVFVTRTAGCERDGKLYVRATVLAEMWRSITLNGVPARYESGYHWAEAALEKGRNTLTARDAVTGETTSITVFYAPDAYMKYRFSLDDNIWVFQDLAKNAGSYRSIFENPYLAMLRDIHLRYGTKFHLNIYRRCPEHGGFELSMMPDRYKPEFRENADWMRFSCHADADKPDRPYLYGAYDQFYRECGWVNEQILRFAGEESFAQTVTTIHWGDATRDVVRAARDLGIRVLIASGSFGDPDNVTIAYHLDAEQCVLLNLYGILYDPDTDMIFVRYSAPIQHAKLRDIEPDMRLFEKQHPLYRFRELCVHEQYFYADYPHYMPDYPQRFDIAVRAAAEHGYSPAFVSEIGLY